MEHMERTLIAFTSYFVCMFEARINAYHERHYKGINKPGKYAQLFKKFLEVGQHGCEAFDGAAKGASSVFLNFLREAIISIGNKHNKNELEKLGNLLYNFQKRPECSRRELAKGALEVFQCFEMQIMDIAGDLAGDIHIRKLVDDAVNRVFSFFRCDGKVFDSESVSKGVVLGKSKKYLHQTMEVPKLSAGHTVGQNWNTSMLLSCKGVWVIDKEPVLVYKLKNSACKPEKFGYRLPFDWENLDEHYDLQTVKPVTVPNYLYSKDMANKFIDCILLKTTNADDLQENIKADITNEISASFEKIDNMINLNYDKLVLYLEESRDWISKSLRDLEMNLKQELQINQMQILNGQEIIIKKISSITVPTVSETQVAVHFDLIPNVSSFVEREKVTEVIFEGLQKGIVVLTGFGGVGKSEMARRFANQRVNVETNVVWINCLTQETIKDSFHRLASYFPVVKTKNDNNEDRIVEAIANDIYIKLSRNPTLLLFDDAADLTTVVKLLPAMLPLEVKFDVLITSNGTDWVSKRFKITTIELLDFTSDEAKHFVTNTLGGICNTLQVKHLLETLQHNPLALQQATAYIQQCNLNTGSYSIADYLKEYEKRPKKLLDHDIKTDCYNKTIYRTVQMTIEKIQQEELGDKAVQVLNIMCYMMPDYILDDIFLGLADNDYKVLQGIIDLLGKYLIVKKQGNPSFRTLSIHGLVQQVRRVQICESDKKKSSKLEFDILSKAMELIGIDGSFSSSFHFLSLWKYAHKYKRLVRNLLVDSKNNHFKEYVLITIMREGSDEAALAIVQCIASLKKTFFFKSQHVYIPFETILLRNNYHLVKVLIDCKVWSYEFSVNLAAKLNNIDLVKLFIENGADVGAWDQRWHKYGRPSTHEAIQHGNINMLKLLHQAGADLTARSRGKTCTHVAAKYGRNDILKFLFTMNVADFCSVDYYSFTTLHYAVMSGNLTTVEYVLAHECGKTYPARIDGSELEDVIEAKDITGRSAVHYATGKGHLKVLEYLIDRRKANFKVTDNRGRTLVHYAAEYGNIEILKYLLGKGLDFQQKDLAYGQTPLHYAAQYGRYKVVKYLVNEKGAYVGETSKRGKTALDLALASPLKGFREFKKTIEFLTSKMSIGIE